MTRYLLIPALFAMAGVTHAADYYGDGSCPSAVASAQEAANKADWIMEGTIDLIFLRSGSKYPTDITVGNAKMVHERDPKKIGKSMTLEIGPCIAGGRSVFMARGKDQLEGKRYRFYGVRHTVSPLRRIFFMEPVEKTMPVIRDETAKLATRQYRNQGEKKLADGWQLARSTDGGFSVEVPGEIFDATKVNGDAPAFVLRSQDNHGSTLMAVFERSGADAGMHGTYDQEMEKAQPNQVLNYKGYPALLLAGTLPNDSSIATRSLFVRVPGGTYMLSAVMPNGGGNGSLKNWERFYKSLAFN